MYQSNSAPTPGTHLSWQQVWTLILTNPRQDTVQTILADPAAGNRRAFNWIAITGLIQTIIGVIYQSTTLNQSGFPAYRSAFLSFALFVIFISPITAILGLVFSAAIPQFIAKLIGGIGTHEQLRYAIASYLAPLSLISVVLTVIPVVSLLIVPLSFYSIYLNVLAIKVVNQFTWGRAVAAAFIVPLLFTLAGVGVLGSFARIASR